MSQAFPLACLADPAAAYETDEDRTNLRRINLIVAQAKEIEAILGDIVEREGKQDMYQGGCTAGMEVAGRSFIVFYGNLLETTNRDDMYI